MADSFVQVPPDSTGKQIATNDVAGKQYQVVNLANSAGAELNPLTDTELRASPISVTGPLTDMELRATALEVSMTTAPLPTGAATETTLGEINDKLPTASADMPTDNTPAIAVRQAPQKYIDCSYSQVGSGLLAPELVQIGSTGTGMALSQAAGNLVITTGTTVNAEIVLRSAETFNGALTLKAATTLSQRIANNNFYVELVDVIGDGLAYNIVNTTTVDVTKTAHGYTAQSVGQRMDLCALSSVGVPMEGVIASIPDANTIRFTVAGYPASGSGTLSLTGWNKIELLYTGTTATNLSFNTRRKGWQNTAATATISTTASGHIASMNVDNGIASLADKTLVAGIALTNRTAWDTNIPRSDESLFLQLRAKNGTVAPATTTTWTQGMWRIEDFIATQVDIVATRQQSLNNSLPVTLIGGTTTVTGTVTATVTGGTTSPVTPATTLTNSAATTNGTVIKASAGTIWSIVASNINAAVRYLKIYNSSTVTVGTTTPALTFAIPAGGFINITGGVNGFRFGTGICIGITTGAADGDTGAVAANEIKVATTFN